MIYWCIFLIITPLLIIAYFNSLLFLFPSKLKNRIDPEISHASSKERVNTLVNLMFYGLIGVSIGYLIESKSTMMYFRFNNSFGEWVYLIASVLLALAIHDLHFYVTHRLLHGKILFKSIHSHHHKSHNPNPWSSFSFHPMEGLIQISVIPLVLFILPIHFYAFNFFVFFLFFISVYGHCGYELRENKIKAFSIFNTSFHHYQHHKYVRYNFGIYLNVWDKIFKTNYPKYESELEELNQRIINS